MSWNLLSPRLCNPMRLDMNCEPAFMDWTYRKAMILNQIAFTDADIICLQELELKDYDEFFNPQLSRLGYRSIHEYKMSAYEMRDGCAIFYRDSRFKLVDKHVLRFNQVELDDSSEKRPSLARDTAIRFNLFHNLALVALLENRRTKRQVQVATTHLLADPTFPDAKMLQTAILTSKLEELRATALATLLSNSAASTGANQHQHNQHPPQQHIPTILAGDFNSLPDSSVVEFLKTGQVETRHFGENDFGRYTRADNKYFNHSLGLVDSYGASELPFTNATRMFQGTIDYLFHDPSALSLVGFMDHFETVPSSVAMALTTAAAGSNYGGHQATRMTQHCNSNHSSGNSGTYTDNVVRSRSVSSNSNSSSNGSSSSLRTRMSSFDLDSDGIGRGGIDCDLPSSASSSSSPALSASDYGSSPKSTSHHMHQMHMDFSKLLIASSSTAAISSSLSSTVPRASDTVVANVATALSLEEGVSSETEVVTEAELMVRAQLPTALPSQHFPSDHIPLAAVFREREYVVPTTSTLTASIPALRT
ncbi:Glucose-repressible alcohol dehydrogenase transcriptional effector [Lunasporangiospora selenospora]|uniref:Glucose-repressible alcohol dehydrogenase transcriptional effector n=1 Tax=Lunasporangiospora selenospora TaxID=979761 RepID=A0A9P6FPJ3_9FUNG|nr:Glucose-repressible alcohol dehydrogenase transcriptional effector [Lunasporangiospora selenospora]